MQAYRFLPCLDSVSRHAGIGQYAMPACHTTARLLAAAALAELPTKDHAMQYIKECLQLLYWIYFKPYTLKQYVREICPEITNPYEDNFFRRSAEARANPRLKRYDDQVWWLTVVSPIVGTVLLVALIISINNAPLMAIIRDVNLAAIPAFWLLCQLFFRSVRRRMNRKRAILLMLIALVAVFALKAYHGEKSLFFLPKESSLLFLFLISYVVSFGLAIGLTNGTAGGLATDLVMGLVMGLTVKLATYGIDTSTLSLIIVSVDGGVLGVSIGLMDKPKSGIVFNLLFSMLIYPIISIRIGSLLGIMFTVPFILGVLRIYFWLPELLWMLFLKLWQRPASTKLPCLPPQFDQLIILPLLPFMPGLIAEAYQENQAAARQTINYLINSTNQQKTARKAMLLIAAEHLAACRSASDIAAVRTQLNWLPAEQTGKISLCLDLSQDTASALESTTAFRREERLKDVCAKIDRQRNALAGASAREATILGAVLDQWQGILTAACRTLHETAQHSGELPQVYWPGPTLEPDAAGKLFKGRRDLFRQIESLLLSAQPPTLVMQGNRRSGKSSALRYLPQQMPSDILPLFVDCQHIGGEVQTLSGFVEEFIDQLTSSACQTFRLELLSPDKDKLANDPFVALRHWLDAAEQGAPGKTFLLCLDEFERIDEIVTAAGSRAPLNFLRHLIQHRDRWQLLFAGAHTPDELAPHWSDCLINTRSLRVSCLDKDDAMELICRPVPDFPEIWPEAAAEAVWQLTQGQPYLIQLLCSETIDHLNKRKAKTVQPGDVEAVLPAAFEHGHYYFDEFQRALNEEQRMLLAAVVKGETVPQELEAAAAGLLRKEVLVQENGGYAFRVPLLGRWIAARS